MDTKQLSNMVLFVLGFLLLYAAMRMAYALARPQIAAISADAAQIGDNILLV